MFRRTARLSRASTTHIALLGGPRPALTPIGAVSLLPRDVLPRPVVCRPWQTRRTEYSTNKPPSPPKNANEQELERELSQKKLEAHPELVSSGSTLRNAFEGDPPASDGKNNGDILRGVKSDLNKVVDTVALGSVPRESYALGLAGTLPYLATSLSTVYLSWNLNTTWPTDSNFVNSLMISHDTALRWLSHLEGIQLGYGAVIISFLGAIHWGLEYAEKTPSPARTRFRYGIGTIAPAVAWPTLMLPVDWALTGQFLAFTALYLADARATTRGWTPPWYTTYRFVLTFVVGSAIVLSLIARAKVTEPAAGMTSRQKLADTLQKGVHTQGAEPYSKWAKLEEEEKEKIKKEKEEEEKKKKEEEKKKKAEGKKGSKGKGPKDPAKKNDNEADESGDGNEADAKDEDEDKSDSGEGDNEEDNTEDKDDKDTKDTNDKSDDKKSESDSDEDKKGGDKKGDGKKKKKS